MDVAHKEKKRISLNQRLVLLVATVLIPFIGLLCYLLISLVRFCNDYDQIIINIRYANEYYDDFKNRIDSSIYLAVIESVPFDKLGEVKGTAEPYSYIKEVEQNCDKLMELATSNQSQRQIVRMKKGLATLEDRIRDIEHNLTAESETDENLYQANVELLNNSVEILTEIIEDRMRDYIYLEASNFKIIQEELLAQQNLALKISIGASCILTFLTILLAWRISRSVTKPIKQLCDVAEQAAKGDFTARADFKTDDEISVLTKRFNHMTKEVGQLVESIKAEQENLRVAESRLMQAQINPHFLYNTLDTIVWLAEQKQTNEAISVVTSLSDFFRTMLNDGKDYTTVSEEAKHVRSYLEIQKFRYEDILDYEITIDESLYPYILPKLMLQPLVENALYHGIKNKRGKGQIAILGYQRDQMLIFTVTDNGIGMNQQQLNKLNTIHLKDIEQNEKERNGFGIANIRERIHYYYGDKSHLYFSGREGEGTQVTIELPSKNIQPFSKNIQLFEG